MRVVKDGLPTTYGIVEESEGAHSTAAGEPTGMASVSVMVYNYDYREERQR
jgi:hypothetical protein